MLVLNSLPEVPKKLPIIMKSKIIYLLLPILSDRTENIRTVIHYLWARLREEKFPNSKNLRQIRSQLSWSSTNQPTPGQKMIFTSHCIRYTRLNYTHLIINSQKLNYLFATKTIILPQKLFFTYSPLLD